MSTNKALETFAKDAIWITEEAERIEERLKQPLTDEETTALHARAEELLARLDRSRAEFDAFRKKSSE